MSKLVGSLGKLVDDTILGWALDEEIDAPVHVSLYIDDVPVWNGTANRFRADLKEKSMRDGKCSFEAKIPDEYFDGRNKIVSLRSADGDMRIIGAEAKVYTFTADPYFANVVSNTLTRSPYGGLWTDQRNVLDLLQGKLDLGWITEQEADFLKKWISDGYIIIPNAVEHRYIDALLDDLNNLWLGEDDSSTWVSIQEDNKNVLRQLKKEDLKRNVKILDTHVRFKTSRKVIFSPQITRFLNIIFERPALAHQSLTFLRGSKQGIHQDPVFVAQDSPLELAASWIALEDIQLGSGELEYYPGSHLIKDFLFEGKYKWMPEVAKTELKEYFEHMYREIAAKQLKRTSLIVKKGDALIWAADLAHGGSQEVDFSKTRKSLVTHYCPINVMPLYAKKYPHTGIMEAVKGKAYYIARSRKGA